MDDNCITISGHPGDLALFTPILPEKAILHKTNIYALYHCPSLLQSVRDQVRGDVATRQIRFPTFQDLHLPVRSTFTGEVLSNASCTTQGTLVDFIVDMVITQPVYWDAVIEKTVACIPHGSHVQIINVGLGRSLVKGLEQSLVLRGVVNVDHQDSCIEDAWRMAEVKQTPIAIIGMALNMPGAQTAGELWDLLMKGQNTTEKASFNHSPL